MNLIAPAPNGSFYDLDAASNSHACSDIRRALDVIGDGRSTVVLDVPTQQMLLPFSTMFQFERIKRPYHFGHVLLLLYTPFGLVLLFIRTFLAFFLAALLPRVFSTVQLERMGLYSLFAALSGTIVRVQDGHLLDKTCDIMVANHISEFDAVALRKLMPAYVLGYDFYKKMLFFRLLGDAIGLIYVPYTSRNQGGAEGRDQVREIIMQKLSHKDKPLAAFPEGGLTNGRKGLLQYHKFLFSLGKTIQPLAIQATDGPFPVNINDETSTFLANVAWYLFMPWHVYTIKVLPVVSSTPGEDPLNCAQRVMRSTASALHQQATPFLYRDKISYTRYMTREINKQKK